MKKEMKRLVLVDMDGTLVKITPSNGDEFEGVSMYGEEYWNRWNDSTSGAEVLEGGVEVLRELKKKGYELVLVTVRGSEGRRITVRKLKEMGIESLFSGMWFRPLVCERWYWKKEENAVRKDWRNGQKWGSDQVKEYLIPIIEKKMGGKFVIAMEDENHETMKKFGMEVIDAKMWW